MYNYLYFKLINMTSAIIPNHNMFQIINMFPNKYFPNHKYVSKIALFFALRKSSNLSPSFFCPRTFYKQNKNDLVLSGDIFIIPQSRYYLPSTCPFFSPSISRYPTSLLCKWTQRRWFVQTPVFIEWVWLRHGEEGKRYPYKGNPAFSSLHSGFDC